MQNIAARTVVLGSGGTIAGTAQRAADNVGYTAAQLGIAQLLASVPGLAGVPIEHEQVAQVDSKDMDFAIWRRLAERVAHHLARSDVAGLVITHGTDTMEETAYFLQRVLAPGKPVVLTGAMRPATALLADGPQNLLDAVQVSRHVGAQGVMVAMQGEVHQAQDVRKGHSYRLDTFHSGDLGPLALVEEGGVRVLRPWPQGEALGLARIPEETSGWPWVELVTSHAGARPEAIQGLCAAGVKGLVVAATGNGTVHRALESALVDAESAGVKILRSSRCGQGRVLPTAQDRWPGADDLTPVKARIELMLRLM